MAIPDITQTPEEIRDNFLSTIKNGLYNIGIENANVSRGSDYYVMADAIATQLSVLYNVLLGVAESVMPDSASGADLDRWLAAIGLARRDASGSSGTILFETDFLSTLVPVGAELTSQTGTRFQVVQGGSFSDGDIISIESLDTGLETNLEITEVLTWTSAPFGSPTAVNLNSAMIGGVDQEDDDTARQRLLDRLAHPPASANWQWIAEFCEALDSSVQKAFVYPAANGPSTVHIALVGPPALVTKSRVIDITKMNSFLIPNILGNIPEYVEVTTTTVEDVPVDVAFNMTLPLAVATSSPTSGPGTGQGWLDASPWPSVNLSTHYFCSVTAKSSDSTFTISSPAGVSPVNNITRIMWIDRTDWTIKTATVRSFTGTGPYVVTINIPFVGVAVGDFIFPACKSAQKYLDAVLQGFKLMGPGEKQNPAAIPVAARKPRQSESYPSNIDSSMLRVVINAGEEVSTANYHYRSIQTPAVESDAGANVVVTPAVPAIITDAPKILIPRQLAFYPPYPLQ